MNGFPVTSVAVKWALAALLISGQVMLMAGCQTSPTAVPLARASNPHPSEVHYRAACAAIARGDDGQAKNELMVALQEFPNHAPSHFLLASLLAKEGNYDQAIVGFQRATALEPGNAAARFNLGTTLLQRGVPASSAVALEEAAALRPDHVPTLNNLAKAYFLLGLMEMAIAGYQESLRLDPSNVVASSNLNILKSSAGNQRGIEGGDASGSPKQQPADPKAQPATATSGAEPSQDAVIPPTDQNAALDAAATARVQSLREILADMPHVTVEQRGGRLVVDGWARSAAERTRLDKVLAGSTDILDLTTGDIGDPSRLLEIDATIFLINGIDSHDVGFNFLENLEIAAEVNTGDPLPVPEWLFSASVNYQVNIANASKQRIAFLARPHLTTSSGTPATYIAGGDIVFKVSGTTSGDIKPYPFGTTLEVTPTLLRSTDINGNPLIRVLVKAGRKSILQVETALSSEGTVAFSNFAVTSEAVIGLGQSLILAGLSQQEVQAIVTGVPVLKDIPILKYIFSSESEIKTELSSIILLTPRDPAFVEKKNFEELAKFVNLRQELVEALQGTPDDMRRFRERHPDALRLMPNRFSSHFSLMRISPEYKHLVKMIAADHLVEEPLEVDVSDLFQKGSK